MSEWASSDSGQGQTFRQFCTFLQEAVREVGREFTEPDDDWMPIAFAEIEAKGADERLKAFPAKIPLSVPKSEPDEYERGLVMLPLPTDEDDMGWVMSRLGEAARHMKARKVGIILSTWQTLVVDSPPEIEALPAYKGAKAGKRIEVVDLMVVDEEVDEHWVAGIRRRKGRPPLLTGWGKLPHESYFPLLDPIKAALR